MAKMYSTASMPTMQGIMPGLNEYGQISNMAFTPRVVAKTAAYTVKASESGTIFTTTGAAGAVTFTLPAISDGPYVFKFFVGADQDMTIASATADTMVTFNDLEADSLAFSTAGEKIGGNALVVCDGTTLFCLHRMNQEGQTVTIAT
jgi:hypothetical protein